jgi:hypothetical protein
MVSYEPDNTCIMIFRAEVLFAFLIFRLMEQSHFKKNIEKSCKNEMNEIGIVSYPEHRLTHTLIGILIKCNIIEDDPLVMVI